MDYPRWKRLARCTLALSVLTLAACGGGGGSPPPAPTPPAPSTYSVGGTVSGLNGTVLLQNNGGNDVSVSANGAFTFTTPLGAGSSYNVTVKTQPASPAQVCSVSNGAGTVSSGSVTNVSVVCTSVPLTLASSTPASGAIEVERDTIPALMFSAAVDPATATASNITLSMPSGTQAITIDVLGPQITITPDGQLLPAAVYTLNVSTAVRGAGGEQLTAPVAVTFTTRGGAWSAPTLIELDNTRDAQHPRTAIDASGNALAVWDQSDGARDNILANRYDAASGWSTASLMETGNSFAYAPQIGFDDNGNALTVWEQSDGTRYNIWSRRYEPASGWSAPVQIEADPNNAESAQIAVSADGSAIAVWEQSNGTRPVIWANRYAPSTGWLTPSRIQSDVTGDGFFPQVAIDANGNATAVWHQTDGTRYNIWAARYGASGGWEAAALVEADTGDAVYPQVGVDANGNAIAVWEQRDGTRLNIAANRYSNGSWGTPALIESNDSGAALKPQIGVDAAGNAFAVWVQEDAARLSIWSNHYTAGTTWGTAALLETDNTGDADDPKIAVNPSGVAHVIWKQRDSTYYNVLASQFTPGSGWRTPTQIEGDASGDAQDPHIAINASGTVQAVWMQFDGTRFNIWANRFE
jgi:hypothetical protein